MNIAIEPMTTEDIDQVVSIEKASFQHPWSRNSFYAELTQNMLAYYLVARHGQRVIGYGGMWIVLDEAHLTTIAVAEQYRRHGVASLLMRSLIEKARQSGASFMALEVRPSNFPARRLYESFGFYVRAVRKNYYLDEDGLLMFKENLVLDGGTWA